MNNYVLLIGMNFIVNHARVRVGDVMSWSGSLDDLDGRINQACAYAIAKAAQHFSKYTAEVEFSWYLYENTQEMIDWTSKAEV